MQHRGKRRRAFLRSYDISRDRNMHKTVLAFILASVVTSAQDAPPLRTPTIFGAGNTSCATWTGTRDPDLRSANVQWVLGFISALNLERSMHHEDKLLVDPADNNVIISYMDRRCTAKPAETILDAAFGISLDLPAGR